MKAILLNPKTKMKSLLYLIFLLITFQSYADFSCGEIEGFEFANGHESVSINDGETYVFDELPGHFYINAAIHGDSQSVKFTVKNLDTGQKFTIIENSLPYTFPAGNGDWDIGEGTFKVIASLYKFNGGFGLCETKSITFTLGETACTADAGTLHANESMVTLTGDSAMISATADGNINVPEGYSSIFVLTSGEGLVIEAVNTTPEFTVTSTGLYTIHTLVYDGREDSANYLDLGIVDFGTTTGVDVLTVVTNAGLCAALDVAGAPITVESCTADAGTLHANESMVTLTGDSAMISATADGNINIPEGYSSIFVLTSGEGLVIEAVNTTPEFTVTSTGLYTIHTLVYDGREDSANYLDLGIVDFGTTTGVDVLTVVSNAGLCAALDVAGAPITVESCRADAGTLHANESMVTLTGDSAMISATADGNINIPEGYSSIFVLTSGEGLVIEAVNTAPEFTVTSTGLYTIHTLVYDGREDSANYLDLGIVDFGTTTGVDVLTVVTNAGLCAALDVSGAPITVESCRADAGTLQANESMVTLTGDSAMISATADGNINIPEGYSSIFVLTSGEGLVIEAVNTAPEFTVTSTGLYTIHTLVYDGREDSANYLDLGIVDFGTTTGVDVLTVVSNAGLCAALDVSGAPITVESCTVDAGTLHANESMVTLTGDSAMISATADGNINVPEGYSSIFVLTSGEGLVIEAVNTTPEFTVTSTGLYTIHTLVYDGREDSANYLDLGIVDFGTTTGVDVLTVVSNAGLCAALDVAGAPITVESCTVDAGTLHATESMVTITGDSAMISATADGNINVPEGYSSIFVLTSGEGLVIEAVNTTPEFTVTSTGLYTIHTLVYDGREDSANYLDLGIVDFGTTTGVDVLTVVSNAGLCAALDVAGAPITVESCTVDAGTLHANESMVTLKGDSAMISATADGNINIPEGYSSIFVLTSGEGLVIEAVNTTPEFTVTSTGLYTIHTLVYDGREDSANYLDLGIVDFGTTTGVDVLTVVSNAGLCAALDVAGAPITVESCTVDAGTLHATESMVTITGDSAMISATADGNINVPEGYSSIFVLTSGEGLVIEAVNTTPEFTVTSTGLYTIHTLVYDGREDSANYLDLGIVDFGTTTGVDVLTVVSNAGLCAALDVAGAPITVESCRADAGTLQANESMVTLTGDSAMIGATADGNINVPEGYSSIFVLTSGEGLVIEAVNTTPEFTVTSTGLYTIHTLVYDGREDSANYLDLGIVDFGTTTGVDVLTVVTNAGLCAALDVAGAPITVESCTADAGTLHANESMVTLTGDSAMISATADGNINIPEGYSSIFVLTSGEGLVIEAVNTTPEFTVTSTGLYTIHTLVYDGREDSANYLDLGIVDFGTTTGVDVLTVVTNAGLCAALDVAGAPITVESCRADAGTLHANESMVTLTGDSAMISATADGNINVPEGYSSIFVLTSGEGLVIEAVNTAPEFTVTSTGLYTIHTLVYDGREDSANYLDLGIVDFGTTTGVDVLTVVTNAGLCAALDVAGAPITVESCRADAGTLHANESMVTLTGDSAMISATADGNINVPEGYSSIFVLTSGEGLVIEAVNTTPEFTVTSTGLYTIHTLVYDGREDSANYLDLGIVDFGTTTGVDVLTVVTNAGLCAALDVAGAPITVESCRADAGTLHANESMVTLTGDSAMISATADGNINVPEGYSSIFVLTSGEGLVIEAVNTTPEFTVTSTGLYTIHTLVYDGREDSANYLDLGIVDFGTTTGVDVLTVVTNAGLCAALDVAGAPITVESCRADAGTLHANESMVTLTGDSAMIGATADGNINVPEGYSSIFVLTSGEGLVIEAVNTTPEFTVTSTGLYTIHTLVYDGREDSANYLDLGIVDFGTTTGVDVLTVVSNAGLCAALDVAGAPITVKRRCNQVYCFFRNYVF
ncbi:beta strand repeat-containing protein [Algibacter sp. R77976]|uniref:beta strand repeat-containing protein n=1 Tax=Algibacter sp. R77976 TaxID=3093873 RepID=UPI0037C707F1